MLWKIEYHTPPIEVLYSDSSVRADSEDGARAEFNRTWFGGPVEILSVTEIAAPEAGILGALSGE